MSVHAFIDESYRDGRYVLASTSVAPDELGPLRRFLRGLLLPGQRELHFKAEKEPRRRQLMDHLGRRHVHATIYWAAVGSSGHEGARSACLARAVTDLISSKGQRLILDSRPGRDRFDRQTIRAALRQVPHDDRLSWEHLESTAEPLIWISDAAAWAHGAGPEWRRRASVITASTVECSP